MRQILLTILISFSFFCSNGQTGQIFINEFMALNDSIISDEEGEFADWIEIYNAGTTEWNLEGMLISDTNNIEQAYQIPYGNDSTIIPAGGFLLLWADKDEQDGVLHLNLKLSGEGESIFLFAEDSSIIDSVVFGIQQENISFGREHDSSSTWTFFTSPTPGQTNSSNSFVEIINKNSLKIHPNPAGSTITVDHSFNKEMPYKIFSISGQYLLSGTIDFVNNKINISRLKPGTYFIHIPDMPHNYLKFIKK